MENLLNDQIMTPGAKCESGKKGGGEEKSISSLGKLYCLVLLETYLKSLDLSDLFKSTTFQVLLMQNLLCKMTKDSIKNSKFVQQVFT